MLKRLRSFTSYRRAPSALLLQIGDHCAAIKEWIDFETKTFPHHPIKPQDTLLLSERFEHKQEDFRNVISDECPVTSRMSA
jgi:hypothetical protein